MPKYEVFIEIGVTLEVETDCGEGALVLARGALVIDVFPGYSTKMLDKFFMEESYQKMDQGKVKNENYVAVTTGE